MDGGGAVEDAALVGEGGAPEGELVVAWGEAVEEEPAAGVGDIGEALATGGFELDDERKGVVRPQRGAVAGGVFEAEDAVEARGGVRLMLEQVKVGEVGSGGVAEEAVAGTGAEAELAF
ncbi:MAG: hypothetical protein IPJ98_05825 [Bryobacterales bacterium]|nr:hypothetical protein [Bryobacterales bacterium]